MKQVKLRKLTLLFLFSALACCAVALGTLFAALHSPWLVSLLAHAFGYEVSARTVSFSPSLSGSISGLSIKSLKSDGLTLLASNVTTKNSLDRILRGEVDSLVLRNPKLTFRIDKEKGGKTDLSFLTKLPNVRLLDIQNAEALFTFEGSQQQVKLSNVNLTVKNFSSKTGGRVAFQANLDFTNGGDGGS